MVECTNFPLDEEDCKRCKEYPCDIIRKKLEADEWLDYIIRRWGQMTEDITLPKLIGEYAELSFEEHYPCLDDIPISDEPVYRYMLTMTWLDELRYAIFVDITPEAIDACDFDIQKMEVDKIIDSFITKLEMEISND